MAETELLSQESIHLLAERWWVPAVRAGIALSLALAVFLWPGITLIKLAVLWGVFAFADGMITMIAGAQVRWWSMALIGFIGIALGEFTFYRPIVAAFALLFMIAAWAAVRGVLDIAAAFFLRREISYEWALMLGGLISAGFGAAIIKVPVESALAFVWLVGAYAFIEAILLLTHSLRLLRTGHLVDARSHA